MTSNASGYDKETAFFDCIYVQDATGGINCFPVAGEFKLGDVVRVTGTTDSYQGEPELQVIEIEKVGETEPIEPVLITTAQLNDRSAEGKLVTIKGSVTAVTMSNDLVESIYVKDASGAVARVFIDGYITATKTIKDLKVGCIVEATGLASYDDTYAVENGCYTRLRVRDRAEILCTAEDTPDPVENKFTDVKEGDWFYEYVMKVYAAGIVNGYTATEYAPELNLTRGQLAVMLYRAAGEPEVNGYSTFTDVPTNSYYAKAIAWAQSEGVINGVGNNCFAPEENITREDMVTMFYRLEGEEKGTGDLSVFKDYEKVDDYAVEAMKWAVGKGIIGGTSFEGVDGLYLDPTGNTTRAQAAKVFCVWMEVCLNNK